MVDKQPHIIWGGVIYREAMDYLPDYFASIEEQTDSDFRILLLDDNMGPELVAQALADYPDLRSRAVVIDKYDGLKPYELRVKLIAEAYAMDPNAILVIGDCDDRFSQDRVQLIRCTAIEAMAECMPAALYYNKLVSWDGNPVMPELPHMVKQDDLSALLQANFIGMSTMALDLYFMTPEYIETLSDGQTFAFDWYLASRIIAERGPAIRVPQAYTCYRIHEANQAGLATVTPEAVKKEIDTKIRHYRLMYDTINCNYASSDAHDRIESLRQTYQGLAEAYEHLDPAGQTGENPDGLMYWWDIIHLQVEEASEEEQNV